MNESSLAQLVKEGKAQEVSPKGITLEELALKVAELEGRNEFSAMDKNDIAVFLQMLRTIKQPLATAPANSPKNFLQQIEFYDDGVNFRLYLYVNNTWRYCALT